MTIIFPSCPETHTNPALDEEVQCIFPPGDDHPRRREDDKIEHVDAWGYAWDETGELGKVDWMTSGKDLAEDDRN